MTAIYTCQCCGKQLVNTTGCDCLPLITKRIDTEHQITVERFMHLIAENVAVFHLGGIDEIRKHIERFAAQQRADATWQLQRENVRLQVAEKALSHEVDMLREQYEFAKESLRQKHEDHEAACVIIADMHAAAMGEVCDPKLGVVEDVANVRSELTAAKAQLAEAGKDAARKSREVTNLNEVLRKKNIALDALAWVWCDGGCSGGVARYIPAEITDDMVLAAEHNTKRLRRWFNNREFKKEWAGMTQEQRAEWMRAAIASKPERGGEIVSAETQIVGSVWSMVVPADAPTDNQVFIDGMGKKLTPEAIDKINKCLDNLKAERERRNKPSAAQAEER